MPGITGGFIGATEVLRSFQGVSVAFEGATGALQRDSWGFRGVAEGLSDVSGSVRGLVEDPEISGVLKVVLGAFQRVPGSLMRVSRGVRMSEASKGVLVSMGLGGRFKGSQGSYWGPHRRFGVSHGSSRGSLGRFYRFYGIPEDLKDALFGRSKRHSSGSHEV